MKSQTITRAAFVAMLVLITNCLTGRAGADETVFVNLAARPDPAASLGTRANPYTTIQAAIDHFDDDYFRDHPAARTGTVRVAAGTYREHIRLRSRVRVFGGGGPRTSIIEAGDLPDSAPVVTATDVDSRARLDGFTIRYGRHNHGAGMLIERSSLTVDWCIFRGNTAKDPLTHLAGAVCEVTPTAGSGGGMLIADASPTISECTFDGNATEAGAGGAICLMNASPRIEDCIFSNNTARTCLHTRKAIYAGYGGALFNWRSSPTIERCAFSDNEARWGGGMANVCNSSPRLTDCRFEGNQAVIVRGPPTTALGGGVYNTRGCGASLTGCQFIGNLSTHGGGMYDG
ncbi:MAG: hypothetical protein EHM42_06330, partial [Planctomycetaceae bacterium]